MKLVALSCDDVETHKGWMEDIKAFIKTDILDFPYPIIADKGRELAIRLGMIDPEEKDSQGMPLTCRAVSFSPSYKYIALLRGFIIPDEENVFYSLRFSSGQGASPKVVCLPLLRHPRRPRGN